MNKSKIIFYVLSFLKSFLIISIFGLVLPYLFKKVFNICFSRSYMNKNVIFVSGILDKKLIFMYNLIYTLKLYLIYILC